MGWVSRTEMVSRRKRISTFGLKATKDEASEDSSINAYRDQLETRFFNSYGDSHDFFSASTPLFNSQDPWEEWSDEATVACGEDCEVSYGQEPLVVQVSWAKLLTFISLFHPKECEIPEEFRVADVNPIDVMAFLQIRRAQPLRVESKRSEWE